MISTAAAAAYGHDEWISTTVLIAVLGAVAGALWLVMEHRRVTRIEAQWHAAHPDSRPRPRGGLTTSRPVIGEDWTDDGLWFGLARHPVSRAFPPITFTRIVGKSGVSSVVAARAR